MEPKQPNNLPLLIFSYIYLDNISNSHFTVLPIQTRHICMEFFGRIASKHTAVLTSSSAYALARTTMETVICLGVAAWRVVPHSDFLGRKDDLRIVAEAIVSGSKGKRIRCYPLL